MITFTENNFNTNLGFSTESRAVETPIRFLDSILNIFWSEQHQLVSQQKNTKDIAGPIYWLDGNHTFSRPYLHRAARERKLDPYRIERCIHVKSIVSAFHFQEALARVPKPIREIRNENVRLRRALVVITGAEKYLGSPFFQEQLEELKQRATVVVLDQKHDPIMTLTQIAA
jgi:hypothetical protein